MEQITPYDVFGQRDSSTRVGVCAVAALEDSLGHSVLCQVVNISASGIYLQTSSRLRLQSECVLTINVDDVFHHEAIRAKCLVARHDEEGMGLKFFELEPDTLDLFQTLILSIFPKFNSEAYGMSF